MDCQKHVFVVMICIGFTSSIQLITTTSGEQTDESRTDSNSSYPQTTESYKDSSTKRFCLMSKVTFTNCSANGNMSCLHYCENITKSNTSVEEYIIVCTSTGKWIPDVDQFCSGVSIGGTGDISSNLLYLIGIVIAAVVILVVVVIVWRGKGRFQCAVGEHFQIRVDFQKQQTE